MATGRTLPIYQRVYIGGYDLSSYIVDTGEQGVDYNEAASVALADPIAGVLGRKPTVTIGPLNGVFDADAAGLRALSDTAQGASRNIMIAYGIRAAPAVGDPTFCVPAWQSSYKAVGSEALAATITFGTDDVTTILNYDEFWGHLLHTHVSADAANSANTPNVDNGAATAAGGWLMYHIQSITGSGTVTVSIDDSANGTDWAALSGATSGAIATASAPISGIVQLGTTADVRQYLRWQFAKGGSAASAVFSLAFMRGR